MILLAAGIRLQIVRAEKILREGERRQVRAGIQPWQGGGGMRNGGCRVLPPRPGRLGNQDNNQASAARRKALAGQSAAGLLQSIRCIWKPCLP